MELLQTWRWFGPSDPVSLQDVRQAGATGIVTALHHIPHGDVWPVEEIKKRQDEVKAGGLSWEVVESVPIHETIKTRTDEFQYYIDNYKYTLRNLATCGIKVVTYNFMPVNDWARTTLDYLMRDGSKALYFDWYDLAVFDVHILEREGAAKDYSYDILQEAEKRFKRYNAEELEYLAGIVMFGIPGEKKQTVEGMRKELQKYDGIDHSVLRENLALFLKAIVPVAEEGGQRLAIHPDDPPFPIFGLPRIVSNANDLDFILAAVNSPANGLCFCTGSLGANPRNNLPEMIKKAGTRINFVHLRNVKTDATGNFYEDDHLGGDVDMYAVMKGLLEIQQNVEYQIPFRPDHGHQMMDDLNKTTNPGYSAIGRMRGLAELRGLQLGILRSNFQGASGHKDT
ncbi:MAG: mannonate dehydratase [Chitinophagaceae bacterium]